MKKIAVLLVCFLMLFAFASCDNGGSSPAESVETTATEEQIATTNLVLLGVVSDLMSKVYENSDELIANGGSVTIEENNQSVNLGQGAGTITGSVNLNVKVNDYNAGSGSVSIVNADLVYNGSKISFEGSVSWNADPGVEIDASKLVATIDGETINGKDLFAGFEV